MESSEIARGRAIEDENARMKRIIANLSLQNEIVSPRSGVRTTLDGLGISAVTTAESRWV
jgi:hypothetical protein